jgi:5-formyltetrahydrofolate cyclo-ligase
VPASHELRRDKRAMRAAIRGRRDALSAEERERASRAIAEGVLGLAEVGSSATVMAFASFGGEVDTAPIVEGLLDRGIRVVLPRVDGGKLVPVAYVLGDPLVEAALGMREPAGEQAVPAAEIDLAVTPGLAFDRAGYRVGYGGGFYDRFFVSTRPELVKVGVCFGVQLVEEVPHGAFDVPVDVIVTEREVVRTGAAPART